MERPGRHPRFLADPRQRHRRRSQVRQHPPPAHHRPGRPVRQRFASRRRERPARPLRRHSGPLHVGVQITAARRSALYRFTYPAGQPANLLFNVATLLRSGSRTLEIQSLVSSKIQIVSPTELAGSTTVKGGWNKQTTPYTVYFYAVTDAPAEASGVWSGFSRQPGAHAAEGGVNQPTGAWFTFAGTAERTVRMKIAISFIGIEQARQSLAAEIPAFDFDATRNQTLALWDRALAKSTSTVQRPSRSRFSIPRSTTPC